MKRHTLSALLCSTVFCTSMVLEAKETPPVTTIAVADNISMLIGNGGNVGVFKGEEGTLLIDDQYAPMTEKLLAAVKKAGGDTPKFLLNTHYHGDHTGGNENMGTKGSIIMAHENVRERLSKGSFIKAFNMRTPPQRPVALPVVTFTESMALHINDEDIQIKHMPMGGHTDGDSVIYFTKANVLHTGDLFFNGLFPFIDAGSGGSLKGMLAASKALLEMVDDETKIIPGHGPLATKADLVAYNEMLSKALDSLTKLKAEGKTVAEAVEAKPLAEFDETWGKGFLPTQKWLAIVYDTVE